MVNTEKVENYNQKYEVVSFTLPKIGEEVTDSQDAFACCLSINGSKVAISDGVSTSFLPKEWARILVERFCSDQEKPNSISTIEEIKDNWSEWLNPLQTQWLEKLVEVKKDPTLPWYIKGLKNNNCASATFVGLKLHPPNQEGEKRWEALAVGDSCLFRINLPTNQLDSYPLKKSQDFKTTTECCHSLPEYKSCSPEYYQGSYEEGDIFILATDALAEWMLKTSENHQEKWKELLTINNQKEFERIIEELREEKLIKNDDTTLVRVNISAFPLKKQGCLLAIIQFVLSRAIRVLKKIRTIITRYRFPLLRKED